MSHELRRQAIAALVGLVGFCLGLMLLFKDATPQEPVRVEFAEEAPPEAVVEPHGY